MKVTALKFMGTIVERKDEHGNVVGREAERHYQGVPARDLDEQDIVQFGLDAKRIKEITSVQADGSPPLYEDASPEKPASKPAAAEKGKQ